MSHIPHTGIIICSNSAVAVHYCDPYYFVHDSHARNANGEACSDGVATLYCLRSVAQLYSLVRKIFGQQETNAFDLHKVKITTLKLKSAFSKAENSQKICFSANKYQGVSNCIVCGQKPQCSASEVHVNKSRTDVQLVEVILHTSYFINFTGLLAQVQIMYANVVHRPGFGQVCSVQQACQRVCGFGVT